MNHHIRQDVNFTSEEIECIFSIMDYSSFSILDIRHNLICPEESIHNYRLPSSTFLFINKGKAEVLLGEKSYHIKHFTLFHSGRDTRLSVIPQSDWLEYYIVFYNIAETQYNEETLKSLLKNINPFELQYGFTPQNPVFFTEILSNMYEHWLTPDPMKKFYLKSLYYQFTYEIYKDLTQVNVLTYNFDIVSMTKRYIEKNYAASMTVSDICQRFGISYSNFYRLFKKETGMTFQKYLSKIRLNKARKYIVESNYSLSEIAKFTGFYDEFHLSSSFKKLTGSSPSSYRKIFTCEKKYTYMDISNASQYNEAYSVSCDKLESERTYDMLKYTTNKSPVIAAALLLTTLLSACSSSQLSTEQTVSTELQTQSTSEALTSQTRTLNTVKGEVAFSLSPKRVVTDSRSLGNVLALGVTPVAIEDYGAEDVAYKDLIKDIKVLAKWEPEDIMAVEPDVIITMYEDSYDKLSKIAPTLLIPFEGYTIEERLSLLAEALGKDPSEGKKVADAYSEKVLAYKEKLKEAGLYNKTFSVIRVQGQNEIGVRWSNNLGGQILFGSLGLPQTEAAEEQLKLGLDGGATLSFEALPKYMGDYILVTEYGNYDLIKDNPIWKSLPAVEAGNIIILSEPYMYLNDIYSWSAQLDLVGDALLELAEKEK